MLATLDEALLRVAARLTNLFYEERAQTLGEYALIVSLVGVAAVVFGLIVFRETLVFGFEAMIDCLNGRCGRRG